MFPTIPFLGWNVAEFGLVVALQFVQIGLLVLAITRQARQQPATTQARIDGKHRRNLDDGSGAGRPLRSVTEHRQPMAGDRRVA